MQVRIRQYLDCRPQLIYQRIMVATSSVLGPGKAFHNAGVACR